MLILSLDTASTTLSLSLLEGERVLATFDEEMARGQAERLIPEIQTLLEKSGKKIKDVSSIAVGVGPGSFTGVRVALAAARGFALSLNIPVWGVSSLEAHAFGAVADVFVALDTKRGDFYAAGFDKDLNLVFEPRVMTMDEIKILSPKLVASDVPNVFEEAGFNIHQSAVSLSSAIAFIAFERRDNPMPAEPLYLRDADVTV